MPETKQDMSKTCGFSYQDNWTKANVTHEISQEEWKKWYATHCGNKRWNILCRWYNGNGIEYYL